MFQKVGYSILGFSYPFLAWIIDITLLHSGFLNIPFSSVVVMFVFFVIIPLRLAVYLWNRNRDISRGIAFGMGLMSPIIVISFWFATGFEVIKFGYAQEIPKLEHYKMVHGRYPEKDPNLDPEIFSHDPYMYVRQYYRYDLAHESYQICMGMGPDCEHCYFSSLKKWQDVCSGH